MDHVRAAGLAALLFVAGCVTAGVDARPHPTWTESLCLPNLVALETSLDTLLQTVFARVSLAAAPDLSQRRLDVVAVSGTPSDALICADRESATVMLGVIALERFAGNINPGTERMIASAVAHELAHAALHFDGHRPALAEAELEADALGAYFLVRAGYDCDWAVDLARWGTRHRLVTPVAAVDNIERACRLAKLGQRPPRLAR